MAEDELSGPGRSPEPGLDRDARPGPGHGSVSGPGPAPVSGFGHAPVRGPASANGRQVPDASASPVAPAPAVQERDSYLDNAKFLAVALVVIGHAWEPLRSVAVGGRLLGAGQSFIYAFHLPVFIVMCGYFSRGF